MKNVLKTAYLVAVLGIALLVTFCSKPSLSDGHESTYAENISVTLRDGLDDYAMTSDDITLSNGLLCFKDSLSFERTRQSLASLSQDTGYVNTYLRSIGITPNVPTDGEYPSHPIYQKFNERFGFYSFREFIDDQESTLLDNGADIGDLPKHFIGSIFLRSALNQYREIRIGKLIHKLIDKYHTFVITNDDIGLLPTLRSTPDPLTLNPALNLIRLDNRIKEDLLFYDEIYEKSEAGGECELRISTEKIGSNTYKFTNVSLYFSGNGNTGNIRWMVKNGLGVIIGEQYSTSDEFVFEVPAGAIYPLSITMGINVCWVEPKTQIFDTGAHCSLNIKESDPIRAIENLDNKLKIGFQLLAEPLNPFVDYDITWNFGDGSPSQTLHNTQFVTHEFPEEGEPEVQYYNVCATITYSNCSRTICRSFDFGCGIHPDDLDVGNILTSTQYKLRTELYVDVCGIFKKHGEIGARSTFYKKKGNKWKKELAKGMSIGQTASLGVALWLEDCELHQFATEKTIENQNTLDLVMSDTKPRKKVRHNMFKSAFTIRHETWALTIPQVIY